MKKIFLSVLTVLVSLLCACGIYDGVENRSKLESVKVGMTKAEVKAVMGEPVADEIYSQDDVWFYYTQPRWFDGLVMRDECTPFVFDPETELLTGYGYEYYKVKYGISDWPLKKD